MSAAAPGWASHTIADGVRADGSAPAFEVLVRRVPRVTATGVQPSAAVARGAVVPVAAASVAVPSGAVDDSDSQRLSESDAPQNPRNHEAKRARSLAPMGSPELRPCDRAADEPVAGAVSVAAAGSAQAPAVAPQLAFGGLPSVRAMGTGRAGLVVGFDTEFTTTGGVRVIDSYQFSVPDPLDSSLMVQVAVLPELGSGNRVSLLTALWEVVRAAQLWESPLVPDEVGPRGVARSAFWSDDYDERAEKLAKLRVPIVLACHYGAADLTAFRIDGRARDLDHLTRLTSAAGGLVTLLPFRMQRGDRNHWWWQSLSVSVRDTMAHAPAGKQKLADLGDACGVPKIDVPGTWISRMTEYREHHLDEFLEYGMNDADIVVEFLARVWGEGVVPPITLSGGAAAALVASGSEYLGVGSAAEFRRLFAGLKPEEVEGFEVVVEDDKLSFYAQRGREPIDGAADQFMTSCARGYHGGLNSCPAPGHYPVPTVDIDAQNAYPTAMASVIDIDWEAGAIDEVFHERWLTQDDVPTPDSPVVAFVSFTFPRTVAFPTLPIVADGTLIYPSTSEGVAGSWVCGPELWLALRLGAEVFCQIGYAGQVLKTADGEPSRVLRHGVRQLIDDRNTAKRVFGKGSIEEGTLKTGVNSVYGKTAQDVAEQHSWDARLQEYGDVGGSAITSPYHAAFTTSFVRAQLHAALNQITEQGGNVYSVTTDGFITDVLAHEVEVLDLYGLADVLRDARLELTGDPSIWEPKHAQDDLVNFTTRGNVSQDLGGVCAHNGLKAPEGIVPDSAEDREYLLRAVVTRDGRVPNGYTRFPSFQELSRRDDRRDFIPSRIERSVSLDYDLKRSPVMASMTAELVPLPDGTEHEMATFSTEPWPTVDDALRARGIAREMAKTGCLRTVAEWQEWHLRFAYGKGRRIVTPQRAVLMSLVIAHRQGVIEIPWLADRDHTVEEKLGWLGKWGLGTVSRGDWDNARRPERASQMLPLDMLAPYLDRMIRMVPGDHPTDVHRLPY
ncbi:hypothetical protein ACFSWE_03910 [Leucobacter albus]|uniref:DNA-directed DNA polymerase n=1 Tax=Leucobacter albus TaxID=272210 RepID=A0ABW3TMP9_9MICO